MDDDDDDAAHYPPNPHHRHKPPIRSYSPPPQFSRTHHLRTHSDSESGDSDDRKSDQDSDDEEEENNNHSASSPESRGKRRKLDRFALGFEFAPRKPAHPLPPPPANSTVPSHSKSKNSPPDWSEDSTFVLLDAWGDLFVQNGRKSLRSDEWSEVGKKVNSHSPRIVRSDSQCRNRLDTLKKKYKKEKIRLADYPDSKSDWIYFTKMDFLMSSPASTPVAVAAVPLGPMRLPCGVDAGEYVFSSSRVLNSRVYNRASGMEEMRDSPGDTGSEDEDDDESDGLPPATMAGGKRRGGESSSSFRILADSIQKFGEIYEKIEVSKRQQMVELERMRNEFQRDLEVQKRQILERAQAEITRMRREGEEEEEEEGVEEEGEGGRTDDGDGDAGVGGGDEDDGSAENMSG